MFIVVFCVLFGSVRCVEVCMVSGCVYIFYMKVYILVGDSGIILVIVICLVWRREEFVWKKF